MLLATYEKGVNNVAYKRWVIGLLCVALCLGLFHNAFAQTEVLYKSVNKELEEFKQLEKTFVYNVTVRHGDTLYNIAQKYGTDVDTIALANDISDPSVIHVGSKLRIPQATGFFYIVKKGDTLKSISEAYGVPVATIKEMSPTLEERPLKAGKQLFLKDPQHWPHKQQSSVQLASRDSAREAKAPRKRAAQVAAGAPSGGAYVGVFTLTAYTAGPESTGKSPGDPDYGITASGARVQEGVTIAADPSVIPMGSVVYIEGIGRRVVQDVGGAIKGNRIDVYIPDLGTAQQFGVKSGVKVYLLK
ncbi:LysM peptidoglycan-binding domain-containing protein [Numidum massiliense]|uniref:LysM peptidoglycan-binding domain-containing protein n=1 Tax=Numidum massiliense TaxID=1522315 RepID=UPI0009EA5BDD|nr:LysM peptidoglycan-binding domain-containing protein [Numidum massiliense]